MAEKVVKITFFLICNCKLETMFSVAEFLDVCGGFLALKVFGREIKK